MTALNHALAYAALRFKVIPLWWVKDGACACGNAACGRNTGKHPIAELAPNGARSATSSAQTVRTWWEAYPLANIGITLDELVVLDVDPRNGGTVEALPDGWQGTLHAATGGGGTHAVYRNPTGRKVSSPAKGIDIKAGGGAYVVAEPSVHLSGSAYSWVDWSPLDGDAPEIHELPRAWADAHIVKEPAAAAANAGGLPAVWDARQEFQSLSPGRRKIMVEGVPDGQRSDAFHGLVCGLTDDGLSAAQIEAVLRLTPAGIAAKYLDGTDRLTEEIARCIAKRVEPEHIWPEPQPLTARVEPEDYPLDALPGAIQQAVQEVAGFVKAPIAMVASSALAAVSLATQAHADVKRADKLHGPVGLFLITIAGSGERKSTCDGFFAKPIRDFEAAQAEAAKPLQTDYKAALEAWDAKRGGELYDVRDVASKSADNAARLAALFHMFEGGGGAIGADAFEGASRIAAWHLSEARRFFGELALPAELADAARLDAWLIEHSQKGQTHSVGKNYVRQNGPIRDGVRLDAAIRELAELERLRLVKEGRRLAIELNPALATEGNAP